MSVRNTITFILIGFTSTLFSQSKESFNSNTITEILYKYASDEDPGIAAGIVKDGEVIYENYLGYANLQHNAKVKSRTRFNIASTAKQFTALFLLRLSMEGKLNLEDDIRTYFPKLYPEVEEEIKIRHLINHTSGIRDYVFILEIQNKPWWKQIGQGNKQVIELIEQQEELMFAPGTSYSYSNSNYTLMAQLVTEVTGESFHDYSERFFNELGMTETTYLKKYMAVIPNKADPYSDWGSGEWLEYPMVTKFHGDGSLYTTLRDQLIYEMAIQNAEKDNNELLVASQRPIPNSEITTYGYGLELKDRLGKNSVYHAGSTGSYNTMMTRFPEENLSIFVMTNNGKVICEYIADEIASAILPASEKEESYDERYYERASQIEQPQVTGQYISSAESLIQITQEEGKFFWRRFDGKPYELIQDKDDKYYFADIPSWKVGFYNDGMVLYEATGEVNEYARSTDAQASFTDLEGFEGIYQSSELGMKVEFILEGKNLKMKVSNDDGAYDVNALNRNVLVASGYVIRVERDRFDRATDLLITLTNRAKNNRFKKETNLKYQSQIEIKEGSIQVTTIGSKDGKTSDILLTKNEPNGNEIWSKRLGGNSWDKATSILETEEGYLIVGSTSSYGNGNYDMYIIKTDKKGKVEWQNTYGGFDNEYGYSAEATDDGYLIKGTIQQCSSRDVLDRTCSTSVWFVYTDKHGKEASSEILEELSRSVSKM